MEITIGKNIKELRKRDNRTQEDLATALGVTCQAISRWESNGGYPDMELVPAIANYFHVSIDELFGYHGDREAQIQAIVNKTDASINALGRRRRAPERVSISEKSPIVNLAKTRQGVEYKIKQRQKG